MSTKAMPVKLDSVKLCQWLKLYDIERYLFEEVSQRFGDKRTLEPYDFFAIIIWKSNRAKTKIKKGLARAGKSVRELMRKVSQADTPEAKVETLLQIWGIGLPIASAVLTVCYPEEFTVLDYRAWETLKEAVVSDLPSRYPRSTKEYCQYCRACRHFANQMGLSLRNLDRALWAKSWQDDLLDLTKGL